MFARLAAFSTLAFAALATAHNVCNTGSLQCCNSVVDSQSPEGTAILSVVGVAAKDVTGLVGVECTPITVVGAGVSKSCTAEPVCCKNSGVGDGVGIGCVPVSL
ncbi:hypothetical protein GSI_04617 [Ganoderma sinense ZZ0214-1]|uniref:Hydrophobin n=1 Tax=Ganoderma sinense ZZ0214-1 TaxID=1077348 RepID=A0A2G8SHH5_9APHY|nr:hypothetical protein GSI_04617 [Ganoderma sinense ZZ0214-1]